VNNILKESSTYKNSNNQQKPNTMNHYNSDSSRGYNINIPRQTIYSERPEQVTEKLPVEQRLNLYNEVYKTRRDERTSDEINKQRQTVSSPIINPASKKMIENRFAGMPVKRVEERLYDDHRKRQIIKDRGQKALEQKVLEMRHPSQPHNGPTANNKKKIVSRVHDYKQKENTNTLNKNDEEEECTFKPKINNTSRKYANQMAYGMPLEFRNSIDVSKYNKKKQSLT
jgi:hypothetical protein